MSRRFIPFGCQLIAVDSIERICVATHEEESAVMVILKNGVEYVTGSYDSVDKATSACKELAAYAETNEDLDRLNKTLVEIRWGLKSWETQRERGHG